MMNDKTKAPQIASNNLKGHSSHAISHAGTRRHGQAHCEPSRGERQSQWSAAIATPHAKSSGSTAPRKSNAIVASAANEPFLIRRQSSWTEMRVPIEKALQALSLLVEGCGIRVTVTAISSPQTPLRPIPMPWSGLSAAISTTRSSSKSTNSTKPTGSVTAPQDALEQSHVSSPATLIRKRFARRMWSGRT